MPQILLIDAQWDLVTKYFHAFREHILRRDLQKHTVRRFQAQDAVQPGVDWHIQSNRVHYISASGHGEDEIFKGFRDTPLWLTRRSFRHFNGAMVHLLSCRTGAKLGIEMVAKGAKAFWGYSADFRFLRSNKIPLKGLHTDATAELAIRMDCLIDLGILNGLSAADVYRQVSHYVDYESARLGPFSVERAVLQHNYTHLVCPVLFYGNPSARL